MKAYEFRVPGTVFVSVNADSEEEARKIAAYDLGHSVDIPTRPGRAARVVAVIPNGDGVLTLNTVNGDEDISNF